VEGDGSESIPCLAGKFSCFGARARSDSLQVEQRWSVRSGSSTILTSS
jgi:hypothetical protein